MHFLDNIVTFKDFSGNSIIIVDSSKYIVQYSYQLTLEIHDLLKENHEISCSYSL